MSFCTVLSAAVQGLSVEMIRVEADMWSKCGEEGSGDCRGGRT